MNTIIIFTFTLMMVLNVCETSEEILFNELNVDIYYSDYKQVNTKTGFLKIKKYYHYFKKTNNNPDNKRLKRNIINQRNCDDDDDENQLKLKNSQRPRRRFLTNAEKVRNCSTETKFPATTQIPEQNETTSSVSIPGFLTSDFNGTKYRGGIVGSSTAAYDKHLEIQRNFKFNDVTTVINANAKRNLTVPKSRISADFKFLDVPPGGGMTIPDLMLDDDGYIIFGLISSIVDGMQTADYPAGLYFSFNCMLLNILQCV